MSILLKKSTKKKEGTSKNKNIECEVFFKNTNSFKHFICFSLH